MDMFGCTGFWQEGDISYRNKKDRAERERRANAGGGGRGGVDEREQIVMDIWMIYYMTAGRCHSPNFEGEQDNK